MSCQASEPGEAASVDPEDWKDECQHTPLAGRTTDPAALAFDRAVEMFRSGLRSCRNGNLKQGIPLIAAAALLDMRSFVYRTSLPSDPEAKYLVLDSQLRSQLLTYDSAQRPRIECIVLRLCVFTIYGGQASVVLSLKQTENLIKAIEADPAMEDEHRGPLNGCLRRTLLHRRRSELYFRLGNHRQGVKEYSAALKLDPSLASIRSLRADAYACYRLKDLETIFKEHKRVVSDSHPDRLGLEGNYAILAVSTLVNPRLGTLEDACSYRTEFQKAVARQRELYGIPREDEESVAFVKGRLEERFASVFTVPEALSLRRYFDTLDEGSLPPIIDPFENRRYLHGCLNCEKTETSSGYKLFKCGRCELVSYCSEQCQQEDWEKHKKACKLHVDISAGTMKLGPIFARRKYRVCSHLTPLVVALVAHVVISHGFSAFFPVVRAFHHNSCHTASRGRALRAQFQLEDCYMPPLAEELAFSSASFLTSHDAATGYIDRGSWSKTGLSWFYAQNQVGSVYQQLDDGARALDLRPLLLSNGTVVFQHGDVLIPVTLEQVVEDAVQWCQDNDDELVLLLASNFQYEQQQSSSSAYYQNDDEDAAAGSSTSMVSAMNAVYEKFGVTYLHCNDVYGLTVEEVMELAALSSGSGYLLALDGQDYYGTPCAKANWVENQLVTCWGHYNGTSCVSSNAADRQVYLDALSSYAQASANNPSTDDADTLGPPADLYDTPLFQIQALWQVDAHSAVLGLAHGSTILHDNRESQINRYMMDLVYDGGFNSISLFTVDNVALHGNALLSVLRTACGQSSLSVCGTELDRPRIRSNPLFAHWSARHAVGWILVLALAGGLYRSIRRRSQADSSATMERSEVSELPQKTDGEEHGKHVRTLRTFLARWMKRSSDFDHHCQDHYQWHSPSPPDGLFRADM